MIDEKKLIEDIEKEFDGVCVYDVSPSQAINDFVQIVDRQPKVGEWIPCSSGKLPEDGRMVLVTFKKFDGHELKVGKDRYVQYPCHDSFRWQGKGNRVIAWMPLPEPYKEEVNQ